MSAFAWKRNPAQRQIQYTLSDFAAQQNISLNALRESFRKQPGAPKAARSSSTGRNLYNLQELLNWKESQCLK